MQVTLKSVAIYTLVIAALAASATKYMWPTVQTQVKVEEKEVIKKDVRTVIKERTRPDGTTEKETVIVDNSKESSTKTFEQKIMKKNDWFVAGGVEARNLQFNDPIYRVEVNRRVLGDIFVGVSANTDRSLGVQVGFSF
jgi:hypothetical protein